MHEDKIYEAAIHCRNIQFVVLFLSVSMSSTGCYAEQCPQKQKVVF